MLRELGVHLSLDFPCLQSHIFLIFIFNFSYPFTTPVLSFLERLSNLFCFLSKALQHIMMKDLVKHIWLASLQCLMVKLVFLESIMSVPGFTSEFLLNLIGFCKGAQRNIVLKMSCVIGEYVVKYIHSVSNSVTFIHIS